MDIFEELLLQKLGGVKLQRKMEKSKCMLSLSAATCSHADSVKVPLSFGNSDHPNEKGESFTLMMIMIMMALTPSVHIKLP